MNRIEKWERDKEKIAHEYFPPRIVNDILQLDINISKGLELLNRKEGVFLRGPVGSGKTTYAALLLFEVMHISYISRPMFKSFLFVSVPELLLNIKESYDSTKTHEAAILHNLANIDLLILDDISAGRPTPWVLSILYLLIDKRNKNLKTTIFTSTLKGAELAEKFNSISNAEDQTGIVSRINGMCSSIVLNNRDFRIK